MAVTTDAFTGADLAPMIPEVWSPIILKQMFAKTVAANFFRNLSSYGNKGGDTINVGGVFTNAFTVQTQSTQGAEVTTAGPAQDAIALAINTHKYIATLIGDKDLQQLGAQFSYNKEYAEKMGGSLADDLEQAIFALWSGLSTNSVGDTATVLADAEIRQSVEKLASGNFPLNETAWFVHPYVYWNQLSAVTKYYDASSVGAGASLVRTGNFGNMDASRGLMGQLYGIPLFASTNVVSGLGTYRNILAHKDAFGFAIQTPGASEVRVQAEPQLRNLGLLTVADILYGVIEMRDAAAVVVNASNSFIGS